MIWRRVIASPLLPPGIEVTSMGKQEYGFIQPGMNKAVRVSTDPAYYEQHADSVELWSPGNPTFPVPEDAVGPLLGKSLAEIFAFISNR
jgi:hypothetical protein